MTRLSKGLRNGAIAITGALVLLSGACVSLGVDTYDEFRGAVDNGASCRELHDIRAGFDSTSDRARIDRDLDEIGCDTPESTRTDG